MTGVLYTGDALQAEREEKHALQAKSTSLRTRIANMAATREAGNKQLTSQIQKLRQQLDRSKQVQHQSQTQVRPSTMMVEGWAG